MRREGSGIRIYGQKTLTYRTRQKYASVWGIHAVSVWLLAAAWWNAFLSVFPAELGSPWLYGSLAFLSAGTVLIHRKAGISAVPAVLLITGISVWAGRTVFGQFFERIRESWMAMIYPGTVEMSGFPAEFAFGPKNMFVLPGEALLGMAGAVVTVPLLELWVIVLRKGKGRTMAGIFMAVPLLAAAAAGYFQTELPAWLLILAAGSYFGVCEQTGGEKRGQSLRMWIRYLGSAALLCAVVLLSADLGKVLDIGRQDPEGFYQETRAGIRSGIIAPLESFVDNTVLVGTEEEGDGITGQGNADPQRTEEGFGAQSLQTSSAMSDLKGLAYFQPSGAVEQTVRLEEPPSGTVYIAERYGITYTGDSWSDMSEEGLEGQALMQACTSWPDGLDGLEALVSGWETGSLEEISGRIDEELSGLAVYDTSPGPTPADRDFVEYFLFERGSGFCVHFASAAVLLYRMNGVPARYAEGYAVPESAFVPSEDGAYEARIDGTMGHAWCQVYDGESGEWVNMEHTPGSAAAAEPLPDGQGQAVTEEETSGAERQSEGVSGDEDQNTDSAEAERQGMLSGENGAPGEMFRVWGLRVMAAAAAVLVIFSGVFLQAAVRRSWNRKRFLEEKEGAGITAMYEGIVKTAAFLGCETAGLTERENVGLICGICPEVKREEWIWLYETVMESLFYHLDDGRRKRKRAEMLCRRFQKAAMERMGRGKRLIYRYVCVYTMWK